MKLESAGRPCTMLILPWIDPSQYPHIKQSLEAHGAVVKVHEKKYHLYFPEGTTRKDLYPMVGVPRQKIFFPDGWWLLYEEADKGRLPNILIDPPEETPRGE